MIKSKKSIHNYSGWLMALELVQSYTFKPTKINILLSKLPDYISSEKQRLCQFLFLGYVRHKLLIDTILSNLIKKKPRQQLYALLCIAVFEIMQASEETYPKVVHYAVEQARGLFSKLESQFVNAVLRKVSSAMMAISEPYLRYSHPKWLVDRWLLEFGEVNTQALLEWDQLPPSVYVRIIEGVDFPKGVEPTEWGNFYRLAEGNLGDVKNCLKEGKAYIQDPSTRHAPELLNVKKGEQVLDLCAAPGGKSYVLAQALSDTGLLVAVDLPGARIERLQENLAHIEHLNYAILETDLLELDADFLKKKGLPGEYDAILLDAPCSNTGVLRRRPDAKWRLRPEDITQMADIQLQLLTKASEFLAPKGRLVYSTCSMESAEGQEVVRRFIDQEKGKYERVAEKLFFPFKDGYDGGIAVCIKLT